jgi:dienelactone hydrolase
MIDEIDEIIEAVMALGVFDQSRIGIGGMSAGGMATLARLCRPHAFRCASVEATTGSWSHQAEREMFHDVPDQAIAALNPIGRLGDATGRDAGWREIPLQAIHARHDEWVPIGGQQAFIDALRARYVNPDQIEFVVYEHTGAPHEHEGFGSRASDAKDRQRDFLRRWLSHPTVA